MSRWLQKLSLYFAAGSLGGLINSLAVLLVGISAAELIAQLRGSPKP